MGVATPPQIQKIMYNKIMLAVWTAMLVLTMWAAQHNPSHYMLALICAALAAGALLDESDGDSIAKKINRYINHKTSKK